jgi:hypothetical protein
MLLLRHKTPIKKEISNLGFPKQSLKDSSGGRVSSQKRQVIQMAGQFSSNPTKLYASLSGNKEFLKEFT